MTVNASRSERTALIDDAGTLSYGQLSDQVRRCSAALTAWGCGVKTACCC
jgi:benzoate-CoA ligase